MGNSTTIIKETQKKSSSRNYFNELQCQEMLTQYKETAVVDSEGIVIEKDDCVEKNLVKTIEKIVVAIINTHHYYVFEDYGDLKQHALSACYKNFLKFDPSKGTAFNYFSIISKMSLLNYTTRKKKHRNHHDINDMLELESAEELNYDLFFDSLEETLFKIINENYIGKNRKQYIRIAVIILDYLRKTKKFISKSDLYSWGRSYGIKNVHMREFVNEMKKYNTEIFAGIQ